MKILVLNTPFLPKFSRTSRSPAKPKGATLYYPIWLAYATSVLEKEGFNVKLVDAPARCLSIEETIGLAKNYNPDLVVMDTSTASIHSDVKIADEIKGSTGAFVVLVGTHPSALPEETLKLGKKFDAVARKEYDYTILDLAKTLDSGKSLKNVKGISFREGKKIIHNPDQPFITNLDELPFVSEVYKRHLKIEDYFYSANRHPVVTILSGRGCIYRCVFCLWPQTLTGHCYRLRSVEDVVDEMEYIKNTFPKVKEIFIEDDTLTVNRKRCQELSDLIVERKLDIIWSCNSRADVDYETLKKMKEAGCRLLCVGFESGVQEILNNIKKGITLKQIKQFMKDSKKAGILVHGCFILGMPGDTKETVKKTVELAKMLNPDTAQFYPMMVYPGTEAYEWAKKNNYLLTEDYSKWVTKDGQHNTLINRPNLSGQELVDICDQARREFYLRPKYIIRKGFQALTNSDERKRILKSSKSFIKFLIKGTDKTENNSCTKC